MFFIMEEKETQEEKLTRIYELGYHLVPTISEEAVGAEVTVLKDTLAKEGASIIADGFPRFRPLAYPMSRGVSGRHISFSNAYFGWIKFEATADIAKTLAVAFRKNEKLLRCILFKTVRESTLAAPRAPRAHIPKTAPVIPRVSAVPAPHAPVSESELDKSLEKLIAD